MVCIPSHTGHNICISRLHGTRGAAGFEIYNSPLSEFAVLGFELGSQPVTSAESDTYLAAVAAASDRVAGPFTLPELSVRGQPLNYVLVGNPSFLGEIELEAVRLAMEVLRDPEAPEELADEIIRTSPGFTWMGACVHGGEKRGTDAALRTLSSGGSSWLSE